MLRLILLTAASAIVFIGFTALFYLDGPLRLIIMIISISIGGLAIWIIDDKTAHHLDEPGLFNDLMNADESEHNLRQ